MSCQSVDGGLIIQTVLYFTIVCTGLATTISSALAKGEFDGNCVLYGFANCEHNDSQWECTPEYGSSSICSFITGANIFISVFYAFACGCYHAYAVHKSRFIIRVGSQMWIRSLLLGSVLAFVITLVSACAVTVGLSSWCGNVHENVRNSSASTSAAPVTIATTAASSSSGNTSIVTTVASLVVASVSDGGKAAVSLSNVCSSQESISWRFYKEQTPKQISEYYYLFSVAESSCWVNMVFWLLQILFYARRLYKSLRQRQQNIYQDPFNTDDAFDIFN